MTKKNLLDNYLEQQALYLDKHEQNIWIQIFEPNWSSFNLSNHNQKLQIFKNIRNINTYLKNISYIKIMIIQILNITFINLNILIMVWSNTFNYFYIFGFFRIISNMFGIQKHDPN